MKFKPGDKVRIKSWTEIKKTLDSRGYCEGIWFSPNMKKFCGKELFLSLSITSGLRAGGFFWASSWLEPLPKAEKVAVFYGATEEELKGYFSRMGKSFVVGTIEAPRTVESICAEIMSKPAVVSYQYFNNAVVALVGDYDFEGVGVARCHPNDKWNDNIGRALAKARALKLKSLEKELLSTL